MRLKRFFAATMALVMLTATTVFAQSTPREIMMDATINSTEHTAFRMSGAIDGFVEAMGERADLTIGMDMAIELDPETWDMAMYIRMPMEMRTADIEEATEIAIFFDGESYFVYESGLGWVDMTLYMMPYGMEAFAIDYTLFDYAELMALSLEIMELMYDFIPLEFAEEQVEGYYVLETIMDLDAIIAFLRSLISVEVFEFFLGLDLVPVYEGLDITTEELGLAVEEINTIIDELLVEFEPFLDMIDFTITMVSFIDQETRNLRAYDFEIDFALDLDMGFFGSMNIKAVLGGTFEYDFESEIVWPEIILE